MKKFRLLAVGLAFGLIAWLAPFNAASIHATGLAGQQSQSPQEPGGVNSQSQAPQEQQRQQQEEEQQEQQRQLDQQAQPQTQKPQLLLTGKVIRQKGHFMFLSSDTHTAFRISNPSKVKKYNGEMVKVEGTVNAKSHKIHVSKVTPVNS